MSEDNKSDQPSISPYAAIKIGGFRLLLLGRLFVTISVQIQAITVGWQIYELTKSALALGMIGLSVAIPAIAVSLYAGHVADVANRRLVALCSVISLLVAIGSLAGCTLAIHDASILVPLIFVLIGLSGLARGFYGPPIFGMISEIVPRDLYANAAAWNSITWQGSAVAGPMLGGFLYLYYGAGYTYVFATALLAMASVCFFLIKSTPAPRSGLSSSIGESDERTAALLKEPAGAIANIKEGLAFVFSNQIILGAMAMDLFAVLFGGAVALLPIFTSEIFHLGPEQLGMLRAAPSLGAFLIAMLLTHHPITNNAGRIFLAVVAGFGLCMIAFGLSTNFYLSLALLTLSGILDGVSVYLRSTIYQLLTPDDMKGRVAAVNNIFIGSSNEIGEFESGVACKLLGLVPSVVFGGCMTLLVVLVASFKAPKLRKLNMQDLYQHTQV